MSSSKRDKHRSGNRSRTRRTCKVHRRHEESNERLREESSHQVLEESSVQNADVAQNANQFAAEIQESDEVIFIKDSCNITVHTTETEVAVSLQIALQLAIALVIKITIGDSDDSRSVTQELIQHFDSEQKNVQKIHIDNSKDITVTTTDTDIAVNVQAMLQVLLALVAKIDVG